LQRIAGNLTAVPARLHRTAKRSTYTIYVADKPEKSLASERTVSFFAPFTWLTTG
jgi:hypothetical protein